MPAPAPIPVFRHQFAVPAADIDINGHVNNVAYVRWMQEVAVLHSEAVGGTATALQEGVSWVVRSHHVEYLRPAFAGDQIAASTWVVDFRRVRSTRAYAFRRLPDGPLVARGTTDWVCVEAASGRPRTIPVAVQACFPCQPGHQP
jgi:acyl-CoA thioester hydrolase